MWKALKMLNEKLQSLKVLALQNELQLINSLKSKNEKLCCRKALKPKNEL